MKECQGCLTHNKLIFVTTVQLISTGHLLHICPTSNQLVFDDIYVTSFCIPFIVHSQEKLHFCVCFLILITTACQILDVGFQFLGPTVFPEIPCYLDACLGNSFGWSCSKPLYYWQAFLKYSCQYLELCNLDFLQISLYQSHLPLIRLPVFY